MVMDMLHCKHKKRMLYGKRHTTKSVLKPLLNELLLFKKFTFRDA
jgi:hypothetical protein